MVPFKLEQVSGTGLPPAQYGYQMLTNRRNYDVAGVSPMYMSRLMTVTTELGGQVVFTYGQSHACPSSPSSNIRLPYDCFPAWDPGDPNISTDDGWVLWNKWKVLQLQKSDSFSGNDAESYSYSYSTPTWHYGDDPALPDINSCSNCPTRHWNDFRGSELVTVTDGSGAKSEYRFHRGMNGDRLNTSGGSFAASVTLSDSSTRSDENWLRGRGVETRRLKSDNSAVTRTVNWFTWTLNAGSGGSGAYFVGLQKTEQSWYGTTNKTTRSEFVYDSYGNVTREIRHGDTSTTSDDRNIERGYVYSTTVGYLVDRPQWEKLWAGTGSGSSGQEQARTDYLYDNTTTVGATPTKGNLTEARRYYTASSYYPSYIGYDPNGRPTVLTDARSNQTATAYDSFYGYVTSTTNDLGHVTSYVSDPKWGVVTQTTDPNSKVTTLQYDSYGRLEQVWLPTEPTNGVASLVYSYTLTSYPAYVHSKTLRVRSSGAYLESRAYVDGFGRSLQSERPAVTSGYRVVSSQKYNSLGQVLYSSAPYQMTGNIGTAYSPPNWNTVTNYHQYAYEEMGRLWLDETKSNSSVLWSDATIYDAWWQRRYDPNGNRSDTYLDAFGQPVQVTEFNSGGASYNTTYAYDKQGNLTQTTDSLGNNTWMAYNLLGWKTSMTDPDMGTWWYSYDSVGNLQSQTDARNQTLYFKYDDLNRLVEKRQSNATGPLIADYTFDDTGEKGLLSRSRAYSAAGTTEVQYVAYDARNRLTQQQWVVPTTATGGGTFRFDYGYNEANQPISTTYPYSNTATTGETVNYSYNSVGQMVGVAGTNSYASSATYNPAGQLTQLVQPGITRQRVYETNSQRLSVVRAGTASPWENRQKLTYAYDNAGNVTSLTDGQNGTGSGQVQSFGYDWLNRLVTASTNAVGTGQYNHTYEYNATGNITKNAGNPYTYGSSKPHAVTAAFGNSYAYDNNGNQTTRTIGSTAYTLVYDYENRLTEVKQGTTVLASFVYDADGNRVKGTVGGVTTVYIAGLYEYSGTAVKSYYTGPGGVVAMRSGGTVYYLLTDQLNSTARIVNTAGSIQATSYYFPFGGNRGGAYSSLTTKRFTGQYHESTLPGGEGLYYYGARWYDAKLGRFVSADTIVPSAGNPQSFNRYSYVYNNPLRFVDVTGHDPWQVVGDFVYGFLSQMGHNNAALLPQTQQALAVQPNEPAAMTAGRHTANAVSIAQGFGEVIGGGGAMGGGAAACGTGVLCVAGAPAIAAGAAIAAHGATVATVAAAEEGRMLGELYLSVRSGGGGWQVGGPIDAPGPGGSYPSWETVRSRYWQNRAANAGSGEFSQQNLGLMKKGYSPVARIIARLRNSGQEVEMVVSRELHHIAGRSSSRPHAIENLREVWPWEHEVVDPDRYLNWDFVRFK
ncbi:MAG: RHS repeat-associated core domain-containing protein [Caldilineaceae bacterium]